MAQKKHTGWEKKKTQRADRRAARKEATKKVKGS